MSPKPRQDEETHHEICGADDSGRWQEGGVWGPNWRRVEQRRWTMHWGGTR